MVILPNFRRIVISSQIETDYSYIVMFSGIRICKEKRCEKDVPSTNSNLISYVFHFSTAVKVAEDLISFTDLLVLPNKATKLLLVRQSVVNLIHTCKIG